MNTRQIARIVMNIALFLETTEEEKLDPDIAVKMSEGLLGGLEELDPTFLRELVDAFEAIAPEYPSAVQPLVRSYADASYLEEKIAEGDPVRLAELEALREARDAAEMAAGEGETA